jgi:hypothetical protein
MDETSNSNFSPMLHMTISKMNGDMRFVGIFYIIFGAIYCLSIIGALIGVPMIIMGLRIREAADAFGGYQNSFDTNFLERGFERQQRFFFIQKVLMIIGLVFFVLYIIFIIVFGAAMFSSFGGGNYNYQDFNSY